MKNLKLLHKVFGILLIFISFTACNSVKRVLKDSEKFEKVAEAVVKAGYCINDTVTNVITKDSTIYRDSIVRDTIEKQVPCTDFDRTTSNGTRVQVINGKLSVTTPIKIPEKQTVRVVTNNIRDLKLESILKRDLAKSDSTVKALQLSLREAQVTIKEVKFKSWILAGLLFVSVGIFLISKLKKYIP